MTAYCRVAFLLKKKPKLASNSEIKPHYEFSIIDAPKHGGAVRTELVLNQVDLDENPVLAWSGRINTSLWFSFFTAVTAVSRSKRFPPADLQKRSDGRT